MLTDFICFLTFSELRPIIFGPQKIELLTPTVVGLRLVVCGRGGRRRNRGRGWSLGGLVTSLCGSPWLGSSSSASRRLLVVGVHLSLLILRRCFLVFFFLVRLFEELDDFILLQLDDFIRILLLLTTTTCRLCGRFLRFRRRRRCLGIAFLLLFIRIEARYNVKYS
jgi:hypothetical protein